MAEFLLELFSEEIPARMQVKAADDLKDLVTKGLTEKGLTFTKAEAHSTPRRITVVVDGLPLQNNPSPIDKKGPSITAAQPALDGFLKSIGQKDFTKCVQEETPKGTFWFYREAVSPKPTSGLLREIVFNALTGGITWPKSMNWSDHSFKWVRPLHSILAIFDGKKFEGQLGEQEIKTASNQNPRKRFEMEYTNLTQGHRFLSTGKIEVSSFADYQEKLKKAHVLLSREERKAIISKQSQELANKEGLKVREDEALFEEIVGLVEWPVPLVGTFEKEYLDVPQEVLISTMRGNQKYIALLDNAGKLSNKFVVIANMITEDGGKQVVAGNEKVLRARLSDAKFFWDQDRRQKLESRNVALKDITFHQKLGTVLDKVTRLQTLARDIANIIKCEPDHAQRAAQLCKADLTSGVVFQFPEVQGTMGRYYALHDKENPAVAQAIAEHYKPVGANDTCPTAPVSIAVALADKVDALVGFFAIDEKPTGSKDPFALRRAALGVIRIVLENKLRISLTQLFQKSYQLYAEKVKGLRPEADVSKDLMQFFTERLKVVLKDKGISHDILDAVFSAKPDPTSAAVDHDDITQLVARAHALQEFLITSDGKNLLAGYKRAKNILVSEAKKSGAVVEQDLGTADFSTPEEKMLWNSLLDFSKKCMSAFMAEDYKQAMSFMAEVRKPIDDFFEKTLVNDPDEKIRLKRLSLLLAICRRIEVIADFSKLEG